MGRVVEHSNYISVLFYYSVSELTKIKSRVWFRSLAESKYHNFGQKQHSRIIIIIIIFSVWAKIHPNT